MTLHLHIDRVVVDGPLPADRHAWQAALVRELTATLGGTDRSAGMAALHAPDLPPAYLPPGSPAGPHAVAGAVGAALSRGGRR